MANPLIQDVRFSDFETLRHSIKGFTVDRLKHIITGMAEECGLTIAKSGKKQELIDRITTLITRMQARQQAETWDKARAVIYQVKNTGNYVHASWSSAATTPHTTSSVETANGYTHTVSNSHPHPHRSGSSSVPRYDPYAHPTHPRRTAVPAVPNPSPRTGTLPKLGALDAFESSPFFKLDQAVSALTECPASSGSMDRQSQTVQFILSQEHLNKLASTSPKYQLRLFCTSSAFYQSVTIGHQTHHIACPIEFPPTCEVRVNNVQLSANLKGVRKRPGTAPPAELGSTVRMTVNSANRVEMIYINSNNDQHTGPTKKYYLLVAIVEVTTVDQLVGRLRKGKYRSREDVRNRMIQSQNEDDEIVVGQQTISLKCPLSYTRIITACRSSRCVHPQCFDATSWYSVMEQTTTWLCPVCEKALNLDELIIDGFFDDILKKTPESVEEVVIEPDAEWHTVDRKYGSALGAGAARPAKPVLAVKHESEWSLPTPSEISAFSPGSAYSSITLPTPTSHAQSPSPIPNVSQQLTARSFGMPVANGNGTGGGDGKAIVILDSSDDEDERRISRELSRPFNTGVGSTNFGGQETSRGGRRMLSI